jgi:hypothetical protein
MMKRKVVRPYIEEDEVGRWANGLRSCAVLCRDSAEKMRSGIWPGNWRREVGAARLLERIADLTDPKKKHARKTLQKHPEQGEGMEAPSRLSDGKKSNIPRVAVVV